MLLPKQCWKDIPGFEGKYQVSNTGRIRSLNYRRTGKTRVLKQATNKDGYKVIGLIKNGKYKTYFIHRLVALAFIPNPNNYPMINHKDENKTNNTVENLEWMSHKDNCNYGTRNKRVSEGMKGKNGKPILMFTLDGEYIRRFDCAADANEYLEKDRDKKLICMSARGECKTGYGYIWKYEEDC